MILPKITSCSNIGPSLPDTVLSKRRKENDKEEERSREEASRPKRIREDDHVSKECSTETVSVGGKQSSSSNLFGPVLPDDLLNKHSDVSYGPTLPPDMIENQSNPVDGECMH